MNMSHTETYLFKVVLKEPIRHTGLHVKTLELLFLCFLTILYSWDIQLNPGPKPLKYPCQICSKAVRWKQRAVACEDCLTWHHEDCMGMHTAVYDALLNPDLSWHCVNCGMPQMASSFFESTLSDTGSTNTLSESITSSPGNPLTASSPITSQAGTRRTKNIVVGLRCQVINFQSIKNKTNEIEITIASTQPDIIFGCETWLNPNIQDSEILPANYNAHRNDRNDGWGGVILVVNNELNSRTLLKPDNIEAIFTEVNIANLWCCIPTTKFWYRIYRLTVQQHRIHCKQAQ